MTTDPRANPLAGNPLRSRSDLQRAVRDLVTPLLPHFSPGGARVRLGSYAAAFSHTDAEFEGYARPLWGLAPLVAGGGTWDHWEPWVRGLAAGSDPDHPEHWSMYESATQAMVEQAAVGFGLLLVPEVLWEPLDEKARDHLVAWLGRINQHDPFPNNWQFFRVLVNLGLERVGRPTDEAAVEASLDKIDSYYLGDGWYMDGLGRSRDHYVAWAIHAYGLIYAYARPQDPRSARFRERACLYAPDFETWFDADGGTLSFGRSLTYRFAAAAFWSALVLADEEALPWGRIKGQLLRHLRWWSQHPISDRDGVLSLGWCYNNPWMREEYSSAGSPYWALKAFLCLAAPEDHPFWTVAEEPAPPPGEPHALPKAGMVVARDACQSVAVSGGHDGMSYFNQGIAKYSRMAYSTRFALGADPARGLGDSTIVFEDPASGQRYARETVESHEVRDTRVYSRWSPCQGVTVHSVLSGGAPWHLRAHRVVTDRRLRTIETGFALGLEVPGRFDELSKSGATRASSPHGATAAVDLVGDREATCSAQPPNTNLAHPFSVIPRLAGDLEPGVHDLVCAIGASTDDESVAADAAPRDVAALLAWLDEVAPR